MAVRLCADGRMFQQAILTAYCQRKGTDMRTLDEIGQFHGTDKSSKGHGYLDFYETLFHPLRDAPILLVELGVGPQRNMGKSLLSWQDYFPNARIVGVDIRPDAREIASDRITIEIGDLGDLGFLRELAAKYQPDILLDDASHRWSHQILTAEMLMPSVKPGGIYICEDLQTSFSPLMERGYADAPIDAASWFQQLAGCVLGRGARRSGVDTHAPSPMQAALAKEVYSVTFVYGTCALRKRGAG